MEEELDNLRDESGGLDGYMNHLGQTELLTREEEHELAKRAAFGDELALVELVEKNLRFVVFIAKSMGRLDNVDISDLISEGNMGLHEACKRFEFRRGYKLTTYASWWIKQRIRRYIQNHSRTIRVPIHAGEQARKIKETKKLMEMELGRPVTIEEVSNETGIDLEKVQFLFDSSVSVVSIDALVSEDGDVTLVDLIADDKAASPDDAIDSKIKFEQAQHLIGILDRRSHKILELRFGMNGHEVHTLQEVGDLMNVSRERIRQIEAKALRKIRSYIERSKNLRKAGVYNFKSIAL